MTDVEELQAIVEQNMESPFVLGRIVSRLRRNDATAQRSNDGRSFEIFWRDTGSYWRCTVFLDGDTEDALAQIDIHTDGTVRTELHEAGSITVDPAENLLVLVRFRNKQ